MCIRISRIDRRIVQKAFEVLLLPESVAESADLAA
jgi:hypothetical protein